MNVAVSSSTPRITKRPVVAQPTPGRPSLRLIEAHARRRPTAGARRGARSCASVVPAVAPLGLAVRLKVAAVACLALLGVGIPVAQFVSWDLPEQPAQAQAADAGAGAVTGR